ncbi:DUF6567 family protein [Helicobacter sp. T3_23-1056]
MTKYLSVCAVAVLALFMAGCSQNLAKFSVASTGQAPLASNIAKGETVQGKSCITKVFGISFGNRNNRISDAVAKALDNAAKNNQPSDALTNVDIRASSWSLLFFGKNCIIAKGQPIGVK